MFDVVSFDLDQKFDLTDAQRLATLPRASADRYMLGVVGSGRYYRGFKCTDLGTGQLSIGPGEIYIDGVAYYSSQEQRINLLEKGPSILRQKFSVYVYGQTSPSDAEPTTFLLDSSSRTTTGRTKPRLSTRVASADVLGGNISADPQPPNSGDIPNGAVIVAYVTMDTSTIVENGIYPNLLALLPSTVEARNRLDGVDVWRQSVGATIDALGSTVAGISKTLSQVPTQNFVLQLAKDIAAVKYKLKLPANYTSYGTDHYLDQTQIDTASVDYLAKIEEGVRFPMANQATFQLGLLNPYDDKVVTIAGMMFPAFDLTTSLSVTDHDNTYIANQYQYQTINFTQMSMNRVRYRVGPWYTICTNWFWYGGGGGGTYDALTGIFTLFSGETYEIYPEDQALISSFTSGTIHTSVPLRVRQVWYDGLASEPYTVAFPTTNTVSGALSGNTFVCPQDGWLPQLNLFFADKAAAGDVTVIISQVPDNGQPNFGSMVAKTTIAVADIKISTPVSKLATPAKFAPLVALQKGRRYAVQIVSAGAHTLWRSSGNKLANGSFFVSTDGAWAQVDLVNDLCMELVFARFRSPQVTVTLNPINLDGGICNIDVLAQMYAPPGTKLSYAVQVNGVWRDIETFAGDSSPLNALPAQLPLQVTFTGTTDMMPGLGVQSNSRLVVSRPRSDFRCITQTRTVPTGQTANRVILVYRLEWWRGVGHHTFVPRLRSRTTPTGASTTTSPISITDIPAPDDPVNTILRTAVFDFKNAPIVGFKEDFSGTTDNVVACYHVAEVDWTALNVA